MLDQNSLGITLKYRLSSLDWNIDKSKFSETNVNKGINWGSNRHINNTYNKNY